MHAYAIKDAVPGHIEQHRLHEVVQYHITV